MSFKAKLLEKTELKTDVCKLGEHELNIREMSGLERVEMVEKPTVEGNHYLWNQCVLNKEEKMDEDEFKKAYTLNYALVDYVIGRIYKLSGIGVDVSEVLEGN